MKVLFDCHTPFQLAHGGAQTQIEETMKAVARVGIEVEPLRWWDDQQKGDLIHFFGLPGQGYSEMGRLNKRPVVATILLTTNCNHSDIRLSLQGAARRLIFKLPGGRLLINQTFWNDYPATEQFIVGLEAEKKVLTDLYGVEANRITCVPLGLPKDFLEAAAPTRLESHLVTTGTITDRKRSVELAKMAHAAQVPILFIGKPYSMTDPYWKTFQNLIDHKYVVHRNHVEGRPQMIELLQRARGFVIYSKHENWCLSAHEAVACGMPILVQDQKWSRECFGQDARYLTNHPSPENITRLQDFYREASTLAAPQVPLYSWDEVAEKIIPLYQSLLDKFRDVSAQ